MGNIGEVVGNGRKCKDCRYPCTYSGGDLKPMTADELRSDGFVVCDDYRVMMDELRSEGFIICGDGQIMVDEPRSEGFIVHDDCGVMPELQCRSVKQCMECIHPCIYNSSSILKPVTVVELRNQGFVLCDDYTENE